MTDVAPDGKILVEDIVNLGSRGDDEKTTELECRN